MVVILAGVPLSGSSAVGPFSDDAEAIDHLVMHGWTQDTEGLERRGPQRTNRWFKQVHVGTKPVRAHASIHQMLECESFLGGEL